MIILLKLFDRRRKLSCQLFDINHHPEELLLILAFTLTDQELNSVRLKEISFLQHQIMGVLSQEKEFLSLPIICLNTAKETTVGELVKQKNVAIGKFSSSNNRFRLFKIRFIILNSILFNCS